MVSFFEHNEVRRLDLLLGELAEGRQVALVSDAGMPGLSDPGFTLVRACVDRGLPVTVLPGASAVDTALVLSGLPTDRFVFVGFLPRGPKQIVRAVDEAGAGGGTIVAFDSAQRVVRTLVALEGSWPERQVAVCRELTKVHEEVVRGTVAQVRAEFAGRERVRGEIVLVLAPGGRGPGVLANRGERCWASALTRAGATGRPGRRSGGRSGRPSGPCWPAGWASRKRRASWPGSPGPRLGRPTGWCRPSRTASAPLRA